MIDPKNDRNMLGRVLALALILGAVYGVRAISRGGLGCPLGMNSSCCAMGHHDEKSEAQDDKAEPAAKPEKLAPVEKTPAPARETPADSEAD